MELQNFQFEANEIRIVKGDDGEPRWVAKDVASALGYSETSLSQMNNVIRNVPSEWRGLNPIMSPSGVQEMAVLTEQGLYFFLGRSDKPAALPFQKWIAGDVIPSIRKTGSYAIKPLSRIEIARQLLAAEEEAEALRIESESLKVELDRSKEYASIKRMESIYKPLKFDWRKLKAQGIEMGVEAKVVFDANYGSVKAYREDVWIETYGASIPKGDI